MLQQYLPFTVLKLSISALKEYIWSSQVATVLTVYGIETLDFFFFSIATVIVATVLTVYGIETVYPLT